MCGLALSPLCNLRWKNLHQVMTTNKGDQEVPAPAPRQHALVPYKLAREARIAARHEKLVEIQVGLIYI